MPVSRSGGAGGCADRASARGEGTGTGLAIVEWVARVHGGALTLDAGPAGGLRARLVLRRSRR